MTNFPSLNTSRLLLRKIEVEDLPALVKYANNKKITDQIVNFPFPYREFDAAMRLPYVLKGFNEQTRYVFAIILKETTEMIGEVSMHLINKPSNQIQMAYWIGEPFWNRGIMTEAVAAAMDFGFQTLNTELIYANCYVDNIASEKVLTNNGMRFHQRNGRINLYQLTQQAYQQLQSKQ